MSKTSKGAYFYPSQSSNTTGGSPSDKVNDANAGFEDHLEAHLEVNSVWRYDGTG